MKIASLKKDFAFSIFHLLLSNDGFQPLWGRKREETTRKKEKVKWEREWLKVCIGWLFIFGFKLVPSRSSRSFLLKVIQILSMIFWRKTEQQLTACYHGMSGFIIFVWFNFLLNSLSSLPTLTFPHAISANSNDAEVMREVTLLKYLSLFQFGQISPSVSILSLSSLPLSLSYFLLSSFSSTFFSLFLFHNFSRSSQSKPFSHCSNCWFLPLFKYSIHHNLWHLLLLWTQKNEKNKWLKR